MCRVLGVTRSWYYVHAAGRVTRRQREDQALLPAIKKAFHDSDKTYGALRILNELRKQQLYVGKNRVWRLMRENDLRVKTKRRFKVTT
ncbi:IS3 family transposase, partial [Geomonas propionica]